MWSGRLCVMARMSGRLGLLVDVFLLLWESTHLSACMCCRVRMGKESTGARKWGLKKGGETRATALFSIVIPKMASKAPWDYLSTLAKAQLQLLSLTVFICVLLPKKRENLEVKWRYKVRRGPKWLPDEWCGEFNCPLWALHSKLLCFCYLSLLFYLLFSSLAGPTILYLPPSAGLSFHLLMCVCL